MDELKVDESAKAETTLPALEILGELTVVPMPEATDEELERAAGQEDPLGTLSYRQLVWRRFRKSKLGLVGGWVLILFYTLAIFAEFFAPYHYTTDNIRLRYVPPQPIRFDLRGAYVYGLKQSRDRETLEIVYRQDRGHRYPVRLFYRDDPYRMFGLIRSDLPRI